MAEPIKWLFFDVGGTIFDDEPVYRYQEELIFDLLNKHGCNVTEREFRSAIRAARRHYLPRYVSHLMWIFTEEASLYEKVSLEYEKRINKTPYKKFRELVQLIPGMKDLLLELRSRYLLGIIGNQPAAVRRRLDDERLSDMFPVQAISAEMGLRKPDLRFFLSAMSMGQTRPAECAMIGDRLDNDIYPARTLGLTTVRLKTGPHRHQPVLSPEFLPHYTCANVKALEKLLTGDEFCRQTSGGELIW